jgi:hypothetical protein
MTTKDKGHVQKYPCDCTDPGNVNAICWIVRHPKLQPPISFETKAEAEEELAKLRAQKD